MATIRTKKEGYIIDLTTLFQCVVICLCAGLIGFKLGWDNKKLHPAGVIELAMGENQNVEMCFKLTQGAEWVAEQESILFKVCNPDHLIPEIEPFE